VTGLTGVSHGLTGVEPLSESCLVSPAGTGLTGGAHRSDRWVCRLEVWCSAAFSGRKVVCWFLGPVALQWLRGLGQLG
jgi:hypothetical protein